MSWLYCCVYFVWHCIIVFCIACFITGCSALLVLMRFLMLVIIIVLLWICLTLLQCAWTLMTLYCLLYWLSWVVFTNTGAMGLGWDLVSIHTAAKNTRVADALSGKTCLHHTNCSTAVRSVSDQQCHDSLIIGAGHAGQAWVGLKKDASTRNVWGPVRLESDFDYNNIIQFRMRYNINTAWPRLIQPTSGIHIKALK